MTRQRIKVIVADDDEIDRYVARRVLQKDDHIEVVGECNDGSELIDLLDSPDFGEHWGPNPPPVLVFLDINMPRMSGFDVLRHLSPPEAGRPPPPAADGRPPRDVECVVLMLTSSVSPADRREAETFPLVAGYMEKPLDQAKLAGALEQFYPRFIGPDDAN